MFKWPAAASAIAVVPPLALVILVTADPTSSVAGTNVAGGPSVLAMSDIPPRKTKAGPRKPGSAAACPAQVIFRVSSDCHRQRQTLVDNDGHHVPGHACYGPGSPSRWLASGRRGQAWRSSLPSWAIPNRRCRCAAPLAYPPWTRRLRPPGVASHETIWSASRHRPCCRQQADDYQITGPRFALGLSPVPLWP